MSLRDVKLNLVDSIDDVLKLHEWMGERREHHALAFDTETTGLEVGKDRVRLVQVGDATRGWAIPFDTWSGLFEAIVKRWDGDWLAHNAKFDVGHLDHMGIKMPRPRIKDTRIMSHCLWPQYSTALKNVSDRLVDGASSSLQFNLKDTGFSWDTVPIKYEPYWSYGALDPVLTYQVYDIVWPMVQADCPDAFALENEVSWIIERMERYGAHVDLELATFHKNKFDKYVAEAALWVEDTYGVKAGSNAAVIKILQEAGYVFDKATASGALALDKEVLGGIDHPLAETVLKRRQLQKLSSTYLKHFIEGRDENDLIHPNINVLGARTSRMSMDNPNLQNLPRKSEANPAADAIRSTITAREGNVMMMCDFDQVEMRLLASMANETSMIDAFNGDTDFFVALARMVYDDNDIVKADPRRQVVKNAGYATIYGAGVEKFAKTAGITLEQGQTVRRRWNELFPGVTRFQNEVMRVALQRRDTEGQSYVRCPVTHRRQVADPGKEYALVNFLIQGAAAAVLKYKILELDSAGLGEWMVVPVHDEIILDLPRDRAADAAAILRDVMNDRDMFKVPITASVSHGPSWGSKEAWQ
jgi:DNA polymerase-1